MGDSIRGRKRPAASMVFAVLIGLVELAAAVAGPPAEKSEPPPKVARNPTAAVWPRVPTRTMKKSAVTPAQIRDAQVQAAAKLVDLKLVVVERGDFVVRSPRCRCPFRLSSRKSGCTAARPRCGWIFVMTTKRPNRGGPGSNRSGHPVTSGRSGFRVGSQRVRGYVARVGLCGLPGAAPAVTASRGHCIPSASRRTLSRACSCRWWSATSRGFRPERQGRLDRRRPIPAQPLSHWRVLGEETMDGEAAVLAEIAQQDTFTVPLKRHAGGLSLTQGYLAWFSKMHGLMPLRDRANDAVWLWRPGIPVGTPAGRKGAAGLCGFRFRAVSRRVGASRREARLFTCPKNSRPQNRRSLILTSWSTS